MLVSFELNFIVQHGGLLSPVHSVAQPELLAHGGVNDFVTNLAPNSLQDLVNLLKLAVAKRCGTGYGDTLASVLCKIAKADSSVGSTVCWA